MPVQPAAPLPRGLGRAASPGTSLVSDGGVQCWVSEGVCQGSSLAGSVPSCLLIPAPVCFQACAISGLFNCVTIHPLNIAAGVWMM